MKVNLNNVVYFDTETTGLPPKGAKWEFDFELFPDIVQLSWIYQGNEYNYIIRPNGWIIPAEATKVHGITQEMAENYGWRFEQVIGQFIDHCKEADMICGHNIHFDTSVIKSMILRIMGRGWFDDNKVNDALSSDRRIDTMTSTIKFVGAKYADGRVGKYPRLEELYIKLFNCNFNAHNALDDVKAVVRCVPELVKRGILTFEIEDDNEKSVKSNSREVEFCDTEIVNLPNSENSENWKNEENF